MNSRWNDEEAAAYAGDLGPRVYTSRLLGCDPSLALHGGGNTSVKLPLRNMFGEEEMILYVKGSGWDLATIEAAGFSPCRLEHVLRLARLESLSDTRMAIEFNRSMTDPSAPAPSVESILHALLPYPFVDHTHADALLALTNTPSGPRHVRETYGDLVVVVPYIMPGFKLARACAELFPAEMRDTTIGVILMHHGIFTFGQTARESYERMIRLVTLAEHYLEVHSAWQASVPPIPAHPEPVEGPPFPTAHPELVEGSRDLQDKLVLLRREVSTAAGFPVVLSTHSDPQCLGFARRADVSAISQQGPATPDHVIRTKRLPLVGRNVQAFRDAYAEYFATHASLILGTSQDLSQSQDARPLTMLDPAPRVILDPELGMCTIGRTAADAAVAEEIYRHTIDIILRAEALESYLALPARDIFDVEYWDLEQAKLRRQSKPRMFAGEIALVTGAASGIGRACVDAFLARGAAVVGLDISPAISGPLKRLDYLGLRCDVTDEVAVSAALEAAVRAFGGVDMLVLNAGVFPPSRRLESLTLDHWRQVMGVNLDANVALLREAYPLLKAAPRGGRVAAIGSRNVPAPGPGQAAYSASKAALTQLARVAALEWGADGIRVNAIHPDKVLDTAVWNDERLRERAAHYGLGVEAYRSHNLLRVEIASRDVAELACELCGPLFAKTTGAQIPVDGGNERVI